MNILRLVPGIGVKKVNGLFQLGLPERNGRSAKGSNRLVLSYGYNNILNDERISNIGIYYITRNFGDKISDLYIGKTTYSYKSRLESHWWYWLDNYRGKKYVRLGTIIKPKCIWNENIKQLLIEQSQQKFV